MDPRNPYAPPLAPLAPLEPAPTPAGPTDAQAAGFGIRTAGRVIDMIVSTGVGMVGGALGGIGLAAARAAGAYRGSLSVEKSLGGLAIGFRITTAGTIG